MSPELLNPEDFNMEGYATKESDCYALGMVVYEVLSGKAPFAPSTAPPVIWKVLRGQRPERPQGKAGVLFTGDVWEMLEFCWKQQPGERISAKNVLQRLETTSLSSRPSSDVDAIVETGGGEQLDAIASDSGMFSPFRRRSQTHLPCDMTGPPTTRGNRLQVRPNGHDLGVTNPTIPPDGGKLPAPQQRGGSKEGWVSRLMSKIRKRFKVIA